MYISQNTFIGCCTGGEKMFKKIGMCLFVFALLVSVVDAEESDRWQWVFSSDKFSIYIDKDTVTSEDYNSKVIYWEKTVYLDGEQGIQKVVVNRDNQTYGDVYSKFIDPSGRTKSEYTFNLREYHIYPDTIQEKTANAACHILKLPTIYGVSEHNWKWFYSTDKCSFYICTDAYKYDNKKGCFIVFTKYNYGARTLYGYYGVDLANKMIDNGIKRKILVPESFEEALYNAAKAVI